MRGHKNDAKNGPDLRYEWNTRFEKFAVNIIHLPCHTRRFSSFLFRLSSLKDFLPSIEDLYHSSCDYFHGMLLYP